MDMMTFLFLPTEDTSVTVIVVGLLLDQYTGFGWLQALFVITGKCFNVGKKLLITLKTERWINSVNKNKNGIWLKYLE